MSSDSIREKIAQVGKVPGLTPWLEKTVLLYRCQDISKTQFLAKTQDMFDKIENLYQGSLPETMEEETYLLAQEYYDAAAASMEFYLTGLESLLMWAESGERSNLDTAKLHFASGDKKAQETVPIIFETQERFKETEIELLRSQGVDVEGIK